MNSEGNVSKPSEKDYNEMMESIAEAEKKQAKQKSSLDDFEKTLSTIEQQSNSAYLQSIRKILKELEELYAEITWLK
jgi:CII-binding regulator of phage lambda lysogenization HflD